jgi:hypothetical protein
MRINTDEGPLRHMKSLLLTVLLLCSFHSTSALAACRVIEDTELKGTSSNDLVKTHCRYKAVVDLETKHLNRLRDLPATAPQRVPQESVDRSISEHTKSAKECREMQDKIRSILRNRSESDQLSCNEDGTVKEGLP